MKKKLGKKRLEKDIDISMDFATKVYKKFREVVKAIVLFGSVVKKSDDLRSDIDIIIFIDDCVINWDQELISWYREELAKLIAQQHYKDKLHVNTVTLSVFWEEIKIGEPLMINVLRYGEVLVDIGGFFEPLKVLLAKGKIKPTPEAVFNKMESAEIHLSRSKGLLLNVVEGFYWAMVDASHAVLMAEKIIPPSPEMLYELLDQYYVSNKRIDKKYLEWFKEIQTIAKRINHGEIRVLDSRTIEDMHIKSEKFVATLRELTKILIKNERIIRQEFKTF